MTQRQRYMRLLQIAETHGEQHALDLAFTCSHKGCGAQPTEPCVGQKPGIVHFGRRLKRLLAERSLRDCDRRSRGTP